ncbi:hypothetical protein D3C87_683290 [compost metagenome]
MFSDPEAFFGERVCGQRDPVRTNITVESTPIDFQPFGPKVHQLAVFPFSDPCFDRNAHILI